MDTKIPTQAEYEAHEARLLAAKLREVESAPLADRRAAFAEYAHAVKEYPAIVAERVGWLLAGSYGYGAYRAALAVAANKRMNRPAALAQMIAALEWACPANYCRAAYNALTVGEQARINALIESEIAEAEPEAQP